MRRASRACFGGLLKPTRRIGQRLGNLLKSGERWEVVSYQNEAIGWTHQYWTRHGNDILVRIQARTGGEKLNEKRDVIATFVPNTYCSVRSIRLMSQDRLILNLHNDQGVLKGERVGVPVSAALPQDAVSAYLVGLVAASMPRQAGACLRCSYLESASTVAAPFADVYCHGPETVDIGGKGVSAFRFEQAVFGETAVQFWVAENGELLQTQYGLELKSTISDAASVSRQFPNAGSEFDSITKVPPLELPRAHAN